MRCPGIGPVSHLPYLANNGQVTNTAVCVLGITALTCLFIIAAIETRSLRQLSARAPSSFSMHQYPIAVATDINNPDLHYGIVVDLGSSGSRVYVYFWTPHNGHEGELLNIQIVRDQDSKQVIKKIEPGISAYADNPSEASESIRPLLVYAAQHIPEEKHKETPLYIMATAGLRMLPEQQQNDILNDIRVDIVLDFEFLFQESHAEVISGKQEGVYQWIAINYVLGKFDHNQGDDPMVILDMASTDSLSIDLPRKRKRTVGIIDMGGGSTQIAYEVPKWVDVPKSLLADFNLGCTDSDHDHNYRVYVTTFLGYGGNEARYRYERYFLDSSLSTQYFNSTHGFPGSVTNPLPEPCRPLDMQETIEYNGESYYVRGTGNYTSCMEKLVPLLNTTAPCNKEPCSMNGVFQPPIDFDDSEFYGFSEFYYSTEDVLRLSGLYDYMKLQKAAKDYCGTTWSMLRSWYEKNLYPHADENRFKYQCFKSAWMTTVLHEGFKFPRRYHHLQNVQLVEGEEVQWTLGALLYKTRYYPLSEIQHRRRHHPPSSGFTRSLQASTSIIIICFFIVVMAIFIYLRRLRIVKRPDLRKIPSMAYFMTEEGQIEDGVTISRSVYP